MEWYGTLWITEYFLNEDEFTDLNEFNENNNWFYILKYSSLYNYKTILFLFYKLID
jgi:hypothetical protein